MDVESAFFLLKTSKLKVVIKPGAKETKIVGWDDNKSALKIAIKERASDNKANIALVKFLSKETGLRVRISSGVTSKNKILYSEP